MDSKKCGGIDLHIHSTASDGTLTPLEIIQTASRIGLQAIAITDHDTLDGSRRAFHGEFPSGLEFITGVEISVQAPDGSNIQDSLHILGYGVNPDDPDLLEALNKFQQIRKMRIERIVERLNHLGIHLDLAQVIDETGDGTAGRPHVATAMVKAGHAENINDAFNRFLGNGRPACVKKERMPCAQAFKLIRASGGIPVLAHPYLIPVQEPEGLKHLIEMLCDLGLKGLEVYYPKHTAGAVEQYLVLAQKMDLLVTGGTDFHGTLIPDIQLGKGAGDLFVPYALYEKLLSSQDTLYTR